QEPAGTPACGFEQLLFGRCAGFPYGGPDPSTRGCNLFVSSAARPKLVLFDAGCRKDGMRVCVHKSRQDDTSLRIDDGVARANVGFDLSSRTYSFDYAVAD